MVEYLSLLCRAMAAHHCLSSFTRTYNMNVARRVVKAWCICLLAMSCVAGGATAQSAPETTLRYILGSPSQVTVRGYLADWTSMQPSLRTAPFTVVRDTIISGRNTTLLMDMAANCTPAASKSWTPAYNFSSSQHDELVVFLNNATSTNRDNLLVEIRVSWSDLTTFSFNATDVSLPETPLNGTADADGCAAQTMLTCLSRPFGGGLPIACADASTPLDSCIDAQSSICKATAIGFLREITGRERVAALTALCGDGEPGLSQLVSWANGKIQRLGAASLGGSRLLWWLLTTLLAGVLVSG